jgi:signal transduction histidine kinase
MQGYDVIQKTKPYHFLEGGGELGELTRSFDWATTSVGPVHTWPQSLRTTIGIILRSGFPMFLWWGDDLVQFYNDAYRPSLGHSGKHPKALGEQAEKCWPEIWHIIYPLIEQVRNTGTSFFSADQLVPIFRNGKIEDVYWTFSYSPVIDELDEIAGVLVTCTETTEKVLNHRALLESRDQLQFAVEATELGTWDYNPDSKNFFCNTRLKEWFGLDRQNEIDLKFAIDVIAAKDRQRVLEAIQTALDYSSGGSYDVEYTIVHLTNQTERIVRARGRAWFDDNKIARRLNGTLQDVTSTVLARKQVEELIAERTKELESANQELRKSNAVLAQFAYISSHDLQEPARKIKIFSGMLKTTLNNLDSRSKNYLTKIEASSARLLTLIRDVLTYSQLGKDQQEPKAIDLNEALASVLDDFELLIEEKRAVIQSDILPTINGISIQVFQLFHHLISNSLKFVAEGVRPEISIRVTSIKGEEVLRHTDLEHRRIFVKISFADNGIGFNQNYASQIFDLFQRLHAKSEYHGTGIGLPMCKKICQNHGGDIYAESTLGQGSVFHVILPQSDNIYQRHSNG